MAYPNAGPGMYNSYLAQVAVYKLLVMNILSIHCLCSLSRYPAGNARDRSLVTVTELSCLPERCIWSLQSLRIMYANRATNTTF